MIIEKSAIELTIDVVFALELLCVPEELKMADGVDFDFIELELNTHGVVEI